MALSDGKVNIKFCQFGPSQAHAAVDQLDTLLWAKTVTTDH